jgi:hypothetical protein
LRRLPCDEHVHAQIKIDLGNLDITTDLVNFDEIDEDLERFQQDEIVSEALVKVSVGCVFERCVARDEGSSALKGIQFAKTSLPALRVYLRAVWSGRGSASLLAQY